MISSTKPSSPTTARLDDTVSSARVIFPAVALQTCCRAEFMRACSFPSGRFQQSPGTRPYARQHLFPGSHQPPEGTRPFANTPMIEHATGGVQTVDTQVEAGLGITTIVRITPSPETDCVLK